MGDPAALATLASVALLLVDKVLARCNCYDGVKTLHFGCSKCLTLDISRTNSAAAGATSAPAPITMENVLDVVKTATRLSADVAHPAALVQDLAQVAEPALVHLVENNVQPK